MMQPTGPKVTRTAVPPPIYLERIDAALGHNSDISEQLKSIRLAPESYGFRNDIDAFLNALQSDLDAKDFVKEGAFAAWLPAILDWELGPKRRSSQISQLATAISRNADTRWTRSHAATYFGVLLFALFTTFLFLCGAVIPVFASIFTEFQIKLPMATKVLFAVSSFFGPYAKEIFLITISSYAMVRLGKRILRRLSQDRLLASFIQRYSKGSSSRAVSMGRWSITLSSLLKISTPLAEAIVIAGRASQSELLVQHAVRLALELRTMPIDQCPSAKAFPPTIIDSLRPNGLTRGDPECTADLLHELGVLYCERARHRHELMLRFLLPIFLLLIGGGVAFVVIAVFLPLTSLMTSLA
jgi:type IV pilus assembly protein PilC